MNLATSAFLVEPVFLYFLIASNSLYRSISSSSSALPSGVSGTLCNSTMPFTGSTYFSRMSLIAFTILI